MSSSSKSNVSPHVQTLLDIFNKEKKTPFVWLILVLCFIPFLSYSINGLTAFSGWFMPEKISQLFNASSFWKLWSPTFIHYTLPHLFTNVVLWWMFARKIERESKNQLLLLFVISAAVGNLWQWSVTGTKFGGLSGVTYALMGYLTVLNLRYGKENYHIDRLLIVFMLALIPLSFLGDSSHFLSNTLSSILGKTSDYAHLGGFFSGIVLAFIYAFMTKLPPTAFNPFNPFNNQVK